MEFLERLAAGDGEQRWLVQATGAPHVAWMFYSDDRDYLARMAAATERYHGPIHPRVGAIRHSRVLHDYAMFEVDDDRGPTLAAAAQLLEDPGERERWLVAQIIGIADGLATLRGRDTAFVHRQLEPRKLFVDVQGHAKLRAPIAYVAQGQRTSRMGAGVVLGTPGFMSPEQAGGVPSTVASDVFALASNLYFAMSGRRPFEHESMIDELGAIVNGEPVPIAWQAPGLERVLARAFAKDPAGRIPDPGTFAGELWQCIPDATDYDAVISDKLVAWFSDLGDEPPYTPMFGQPCKKRWTNLRATPDATIRFCTECAENVVQVRSISAIVPLGGGCVAYTGGE